MLDDSICLAGFPVLNLLQSLIIRDHTRVPIGFIARRIGAVLPGLHEIFVTLLQDKHVTAVFITTPIIMVHNVVFIQIGNLVIDLNEILKPIQFLVGHKDILPVHMLLYSMW
jgi:hypothetical protein